MLRTVAIGPGKMDLAILAHDPAQPVDEDRRVEPALPAGRHVEFAIAELEPDPQARRGVEERLGRGAWHLALEPGIEFGFVLDPPMREEGREGGLGIDNEIGAHATRLHHHPDQSRHRLLARLAARYRPHLRGSDDQCARHPWVSCVARFNSA